MISLNAGVILRLVQDVGSIKKGSLVTVVKPIDWGTKAIVEDEHGNKEEVVAPQFRCFGLLNRCKNLFEITEEYEVDCAGGRKEKRYKGILYLTDNIRKPTSYGLEMHQDFLYMPNPRGKYYTNIEIEEREMTDGEVANMIFDEIIYGIQPNLQSRSCVGYLKNGIDQDGNYRNGHYLLPNNKVYTVTWCWGDVRIREGIDGGWYKGVDEVGRTVFEGKLDYKKYQEALIWDFVHDMFEYKKPFADAHPDAAKALYESYKNLNRFKMYNELPEEMREGYCEAIYKL